MFTVVPRRMATMLAMTTHLDLGLHNDRPEALAWSLRSAERQRPERQPLEVIWAQHEDDVRAAQALRWRVFVAEMGASLRPPVGTPPEHDADTFDGHCQHLLVRTVPAGDEPARVVATYRVLTPSAARRVGRLYSDEEFDLRGLFTLRPWMAELGRACVDPAYRGGGAVLLMWSELSAFMQRNHIQRVIGCASVPMHDGGHRAASLWHQLSGQPSYQSTFAVRPRFALPVHRLRCDLQVDPPALLKGYLRAGAKVLGPPAWDPAFNTADLPLMLTLNEMEPRYRRRFSTVPAKSAKVLAPVL